MTSGPVPPPRLYVIPATDAPRAIVFRRSRGWWLLLDWDLATHRLTPGAWFRGALYPRRCDLSPDGSLFAYFALRKTIAYQAISKSAWLFALAWWKETGTYSRGIRFTREPPTQGQQVGPPDTGTCEPLGVRHRLHLAHNGAQQYAVERRRGWVEHEDCPPRGRNDMWDERRNVILTKPSPLGDRRLVLRDRGRASNPSQIEGRRPAFAVALRREAIELPDVVWADWDRTGRLLVATESGRLEVRDARDHARVRVVHDLVGLSVARGPAPAWAQSW